MDSTLKLTRKNALKFQHVKGENISRNKKWYANKSHHVPLINTSAKTQKNVKIFLLARTINIYKTQPINVSKYQHAKKINISPGTKRNA